MESLGEELRVLYVALTRAKEKLILSGTIGALRPELEELSALRDSEEPLLSLGRRLCGKTYWDYVLPALVRHRCMAPLFHEYGILTVRFGRRSRDVFPLYIHINIWKTFL